MSAIEAMVGIIAVQPHTFISDAHAFVSDETDRYEHGHGRLHAALLLLFLHRRDQLRVIARQRSTHMAKGRGLAQQRPSRHNPAADRNYAP